MNFIFSAVFAYFFYKIMTVYGSIVESVAEPGAWVVFLAVLWLSEFMGPEKQLKKYKAKKEAELKVLKDENNYLKKLLKEKDKDKEIEQELNFFKKEELK